MEDVLEVYKRSYNSKNPVVCFDESPKQLISEKRKGFKDKKGTHYIDYEYKREGVADMFMIVEPLAGRREVLIRDSHNRLEWAKAIAYIVEKMYPDAEKITLIQDNLAAHKKSALYEIFKPERARNIINKLELVWTPKHGSWLNIAEAELSILTRQGIATRVPDKETLTKQAEEWYKIRNGKDSKIDWQFSSKDARIKLKRLYPSA